MSYVKPYVDPFPAGTAVYGLLDPGAITKAPSPLLYFGNPLSEQAGLIQIRDGADRLDDLIADMCRQLEVLSSRALGRQRGWIVPVSPSVVVVAQRVSTGGIIEVASSSQHETLVEVPTLVPQQTYAECLAAARSLAFGPTLNGWSVADDGDIGLSFTTAKSDFQICLRDDLLSDLGLPHSPEFLQDEVKRTGLRAVLLLHVCIFLALNNHRVPVCLDELMLSIGLVCRTVEDRAQNRRLIYRWLCLFDRLEIHGHRRSPRPFKDRMLHEAIVLETEDPLIRITGRDFTPHSRWSIDNGRVPMWVSFVAGEWLNRMREHPHALFNIGNVRSLAGFSARQPSGAFGISLGLGLQQMFRVRAYTSKVRRKDFADECTVTIPGTLTLLYLTSLVPPFPAIESYRDDGHLVRARDYAGTALCSLRAKGIFKTISGLTLPPQGQRVDPAAWAKKHWPAGDWFDTPLTIEPGGAIAESISRIARPHRPR